MDHFIDQHRGEGQDLSEGAFTMAMGGEALRKLAVYSLPFEGAWVVKVVQAAVSAGAAEICIVQDREVTHITMPGAQFPAPDQVCHALAHAEPTKVPCLAHLVPALRQIGMNFHRGFRLYLSGVNQMVEWNGGQLSPPQDTEPVETTLEVDHLSRQEREDYVWFSKTALRAERCAAVATALQQRCFTCPVPLWLDHLPHSNLRRVPIVTDVAIIRPRQVAIMLNFPDLDLPLWDVPPDTFPEDHNPGLAEWSSSNPPLKVPAAILLNGLYHSNSYILKAVPQASKLYFLQHGAVIDSLKLEIPKLPLSLHLFLSADGLSLDLTGLSVRETEEKARRLQAIFRATRQLLEEFQAPDTPQDLDYRPGVRTRGKLALVKAVGAGLFGSVGMMLGLPLVKVGGLGLVALAALGGGGLGLTMDVAKERLPPLSEPVNDLKQAWCEAYPDGRPGPEDENPLTAL